MKKIIQFQLNYISIILLSLFSFLITIYFGFIGVNPLDNFITYNSGYYILQGQVPFKDFWVTHGLFLDLIQSILFKLFGVNWLVYSLHSAIINLIFTLTTYFVFRSFNLSKFFSIIYCFLLSSISYSQVGTPFPDHHAIILSLIALEIMFLAILTKKNLFWFIFPVIFFLAFFSKQAPSIYFIFFASIIILLNIFFRTNFKNIFFLTLGIFFSIFSLIFFLKFYEINFIDFYNQYFLFASSIGKERVEVGFLYPINFSRYFLKFKLIHISYFPLLIILIRNTMTKISFVKTKDFLFLICLILSSFSLIIHQLLTLNTKFVYLIIPLLFGFSHIFLDKYFYKNKFIYLILILSLIFTLYYFFYYVNSRKFVVLDNDLKKSISTKVIDDRYNFNWISILDKYPDEEIKKINRIINYFKNNKNYNNLIITDYQFIFSKLELNKNIYINKWYHPGVSYPNPDNKNFINFKNFLEEKIKLNDINNVYFVLPSWFKDENQKIFRYLYKDCLIEKSYFKGSLINFNIKNCFNF